MYCAFDAHLRCNQYENRHDNVLKQIRVERQNNAELETIERLKTAMLIQSITGHLSNTYFSHKLHSDYFRHQQK